MAESARAGTVRGAVGASDWRESGAGSMGESAAAPHVDLDVIAEAELAALRARGTHRRMRRLGGNQGPRMRVDGREVHLFAGSNYLDLAAHPELIAACHQAAADFGCASGGSRLICGNLVCPYFAVTS